MLSAAEALLPLIVLGAVCAAFSYSANGLLMPLFKRYAMARPNARSSHKEPTPQGGGAGVLLGLLAGLGAMATAGSSHFLAPPFLALAVSAILLALTGALDDMFSLSVRIRLIAQVAACAFALFGICTSAPLPFGVAALVIVLPALMVGLMWFVNLTNFMDGIDGITVAEFVPMCLALAALEAIGRVPVEGGIAAGLAGALVGFLPFNRHVARLFLGDLGSLWIGLIAGCLLLRLALAGYPVAAAILPLYYLADATITLIRRFRRGENVTQAHRTHFYQRATDLGWSVPAITGRIWLTNAGLALLAFVSVWFNGALIQVIALLAAAALVGWLLAAFSRPPAR